MRARRYKCTKSLSRRSWVAEIRRLISRIKCFVRVNCVLKDRDMTAHAQGQDVVAAYNLVRMAKLSKRPLGCLQS